MSSKPKSNTDSFGPPPTDKNASQNSRQDTASDASVNMATKSIVNYQEQSDWCDYSRNDPKQTPQPYGSVERSLSPGNFSDSDAHQGWSTGYRFNQSSGALGLNVKRKVFKGFGRYEDRDSGEKSEQPRNLSARSEAQFQTMQQEINHFKEIGISQKSEIAELSIKLNIEKESNKESRDRLLLAMENKDLFIGRQDTDEIVTSRFGQLIGQIKTWSVPFAEQGRPPSHEIFSRISKDVLRKVVPHVSAISDLEGVLQTPKHLRLFVRGWVGLAVAETLFRTSPTESHPECPIRDTWMDKEMAQAIHSIEMRFTQAGQELISLRELHDWRAFTTTLVSRQASPSETNRSVDEHVASCMNRILAVLDIFAPADKKSQLMNDLSGTLVQAVQLSQTLRCQRACWSVRSVPLPPPAPVPSIMFFDQYIMEDMDDTSAIEDDEGHAPLKMVDIIISPALFKRGNTDGEKFEIETCMARAQVRAHSLVTPGSGRRYQDRSHR